ncbi:tryptophan dimethylallyltransferase family protein [Umezawaea sp.]|uniref:tryptophan dimethylallyltransferase family protein n=1 Tax=Umezawaea sp. TaxID=1955258 RepID=UPI002ED2F81C
MNPTGVSIRDFGGSQLRDLLHSVHLGGIANNSVELLSETLGPGGFRPLSNSPSWRSGVADDHTPFEFSTAFAVGEPAMVRVLVEPTAAEPSPAANMDAALDVLDSLAGRHGLPLDRFDAVRDLFLPSEPQGEFSLWFSLVFRADAKPVIKVYLNPEVRGRAEAPLLVGEGLARLGYGAGHATIVDHARRRGDLDRYSFFALDLTESSGARAKVYLSHQDATPDDAVVAASAAHGVDAETVRDFCLVAGGRSDPFTGRPLISSYTFLPGDVDRPSGYSLYLPVRSYVNDDSEARLRVLATLDQHLIDPTAFRSALGAVARRPLADGVGLIAHVSLRIGAPRPGVTVYLSSEAHSTASPRVATLVS